jgi:Putative beta-barrel porin-2, OmpL-like. bbp2
MSNYSVLRNVVFAALVAGLALTQNSYAQANADAASNSSAAVSNSSADSTQSDLAARIDALQKELSQLKSQMEAEQTQTLAVATPEPSPAQAATSAATPATPPAPTLAGLLGPTTLSGFVDGYYGYNANQPADRTNGFRSFETTSSQFSLNMMELVADKPADSASRVGYHVALGFGQAMNAVNGTEPGFLQYVKESYLEYMAPVGSGLQINFGKFVTPAGAEVIESKDNWNYTRGILFSWAIPYFHFGLSAKYTFNPKVSLTAYLVNGWNDTIDDNSGKTTGFSLAITPNAKWSLTENYLVGPEQPNDNSDIRQLNDTVVSYTPTGKLSLMANYDYGHDTPMGSPTSVHWSGIAGYIKYAPNGKWAIATRGEYFDDADNFATASINPVTLASFSSNHMSEFTATLQRMLAGKIISRLEFRRDMADNPIFLSHTATAVDSQNTVTVGLVYAFSSADAK